MHALPSICPDLADGVGQPAQHQIAARRGGDPDIVILGGQRQEIGSKPGRQTAEERRSTERK
jgi:hypothetical protein